jgi:hypothetical protein
MTASRLAMSSASPKQHAAGGASSTLAQFVPSHSHESEMNAPSRQVTHCPEASSQ